MSNEERVAFTPQPLVGQRMSGKEILIDEKMPKITDLFPETDPKRNGGQEVIIGESHIIPWSKPKCLSYKVFVGNSEPQKEYYLHVYDNGSCELVDEEGMVDPEHDASADADQTDKVYDRERDRRMEEA